MDWEHWWKIKTDSINRYYRYQSIDPSLILPGNAHQRHHPPLWAKEEGRQYPTWEVDTIFELYHMMATKIENIVTKKYTTKA